MPSDVHDSRFRERPSVRAQLRDPSAAGQAAAPSFGDLLRREEEDSLDGIHDRDRDEQNVDASVHSLAQVSETSPHEELREDENGDSEQEDSGEHGPSMASARENIH